MRPDDIERIIGWLKHANNPETSKRDRTMDIHRAITMLETEFDTLADALTLHAAVNAIVSKGTAHEG